MEHLDEVRNSAVHFVGIHPAQPNRFLWLTSSCDCTVTVAEFLKTMARLDVKPLP
ncbi:MAG: hypothetical protein RMI89_12460 [Gloeomargarita sp. SKYBB_i_bin120]|nr:hypothetical protein [Gloeomargarita sp. SKYB120]MDW8179323.1 hypothetical protein [Gloeomargarita sp. SKYBB_i_bin120]